MESKAPDVQANKEGQQESGDTDKVKSAPSPEQNKDDLLAAAGVPELPASGPDEPEPEDPAQTDDESMDARLISID